MNTFNANFSSSPASNYLPTDTPPKRNVFFQPAEPASTTPAAPPPSQVFGSSQYGSGVSKFQLGRDANTAPSSAPRQFQSSRTRISTPGRPKSRLFQYSTNIDNSEMEEDYTDDDMEEDWQDEDVTQNSVKQSGFVGINRTKNTTSAPSLMKFSTNSLSQSVALPKRRGTGTSRSQLPRKGREDLVPGLVRDITRRTQAATLIETDIVILETEQVCRQLEEACQAAQHEFAQQIMISGAAQELIHFWRMNSEPSIVEPEQAHIGPLPSEPQFEKARYIASLLLELYHPQAQTDNGQSMVLSDSRMSMNDFQTKPTPQILLEWLQKNHIDYQYLFDQVSRATSNVTADDLFWEAIEVLTLHGRIQLVMHLLAEADFNYAVMDTVRGYTKANYTGTQLQAIQRAIYQMRQLLNACPAVQIDDWNVDGQEWDVYRKQVEESLSDLADLADEHNVDDVSTQNSNDLFAKSTRKANLPFDVYTHLKTVHNILLGDVDIIMGLAQDWLEASLLLTVWWNGSQETKVAQWSFDVSRANHTEETASGNPHLTRLRDAFLCVTDPMAASNYHINTMSHVELGVGAVLQGDTQSVLRVLSTMSLCVASAFAEIGTWAGWQSTATPTAGLDEADLMVLNFGANDAIIKKDDVLNRYANALFKKDEFRMDEESVAEGWEVAFAVVSRMDDEDRIESSVSNFIDQITMDDQERTAKLVNVCQDLGLQAQGRKVSEAFGDHLVNQSTDYGTALLCYARAHSEAKVRQLVDLLSSYCLVQSTAYPAKEHMDTALERLVGNPQEALQSIVEVDPLAAEALQFYLVGYACIRKFYTLRDETGSATKTAGKTMLARKKAASRALLAAINSAADCIYGGLYDPERRTAIQVDGLLTLLGEATALLAKDEGARVLTCNQMYNLLAAIEDLETVNDRVYRATEDCMEAALRNFNGSPPPSPHMMLKKSVSSGTNSNFSFSMMGSEMLRSADSVGGKSVGSAVLIGSSEQSKANRGWDWREEFQDAGNAGKQILRRLRIGIAKELSVTSIEENEMSVYS